MSMENKCVVCGKDKGRNKLFCSQECRVKYLRNKRTCVICGREFLAPPSSGKITCSVECERKNRMINWKTNPIYAMTLERAHEAAKTNPNTAPVETNATAKSWVIVSPQGTRYEINNLALWAREHTDILPSTPDLFCDGIRAIKRTQEGKKKRGAHQYRGWTLEKYYDENLSRKDLPERKKRVSRSRMSDEQRLERKRQRARDQYQKRKNSPGE